MTVNTCKYLTAYQNLGPLPHSLLKGKDFFFFFVLIRLGLFLWELQQTQFVLIVTHIGVTVSLLTTQESRRKTLVFVQSLCTTLLQHISVPSVRRRWSFMSWRRKRWCIYHKNNSCICDLIFLCQPIRKLSLEVSVYIKSQILSNLLSSRFLLRSSSFRSFPVYYL